MPATSMRTTTSYEGPFRLAITIMALALLCSLGAAQPAPASARNWTREIAATRASQVYYENVMRGADRELRSLKRARKQTQRSLKKAQRSLSKALDRRGATKAQLGLLRSRVRNARVALAASAFDPPPPPDTATAILTLAAIAEPATEAANAVLPAESQESAFLVVAADDMNAFRTEVTVGDVVALQRQLRKQERASKRAGQHLQQVSRVVRVKRNTLASIRGRMRSATARREGAEAALGGRILAMSTLAQRRIAKKTKVRPGVNSGFAWPASGRLTQSYGCTGFALNPSRGSCRHFHDGIDIAGYRGTAIRAAAVGVVSYVGWNPWDQNGRAFMVVVAHPGGYETLYAHVLPARRVRVGQLVHRGEVIGYMGSTGHSTGVHLHLELRRGRTTLNPLAFL